MIVAVLSGMLNKNLPLFTPISGLIPFRLERIEKALLIGTLGNI